MKKENLSLLNTILLEGWNSMFVLKFNVWFEIIVGESIVKSPYEFAVTRLLMCRCWIWQLPQGGESSHWSDLEWKWRDGIHTRFHYRRARKTLPRRKLFLSVWADSVAASGCLRSSPPTLWKMTGCLTHWCYDYHYHYHYYYHIVVITLW